LELCWVWLNEGLGLELRLSGSGDEFLLTGKKDGFIFSLGGGNIVE
jgi:hypothetical protein